MSTPTSSPSLSQTLSNLGLGYAIAISFGFLVLLSTLLLSSYICCRRRHHPPAPSADAGAGPGAGGVILPRIIFVAEDDNDDDNRDQNGVVGLDQNVINSYPRFRYSRKNCESDNLNLSDSNLMCSICLCDYKEAEMLRMMPDCKHFFHVGCLDAWLKLNGSCPVCRNSPLPTPLSTPLAEVVPLSQYTDNRRRSS